MSAYEAMNQENAELASLNADLKRQLAELRNTHSLVTSMLNETLRLPEPLDLVEMPGRVAAAVHALRLKAEALHLAIAPLSVKAGVSDEKLNEVLAVALEGAREVVAAGETAEILHPGFIGVDLAAGRDQTVVAFKGLSDFTTRDGEAAAHAVDGEWLQPSTNPFGHGCCDCGLYHDVLYRFVTVDGEQLDQRGRYFPEELALQLSFTRDEEQTARLREHQAANRTPAATVRVGLPPASLKALKEQWREQDEQKGEV